MTPLPDHTNHECKIRELEALLPFYTEHLNTIRSLLSQVQGYQEIVDRGQIPADKLRLDEFAKTLRFHGFLTAAVLDLVVTSKNLLKINDVWEEIYYLRHGYLTIYEMLNTYADYSRWLKEMATETYPALQGEFERLKSQLKQFKSIYGYHNYMPDLRKKVTAHITSDFEMYFTEISAFDREKGIEALLEFIQIVSAMQQLSKNLQAESKLRVEMYSRELEQRVQESMQKITEAFEKLAGRFKHAADIR